MAVDEKQEECKENLRNHRDQTQKQGDHIQQQLAELTAKMKAIEHGKYYHPSNAVTLSPRRTYFIVHRQRETGE